MKKFYFSFILFFFFSFNQGVNAQTSRNTDSIRRNYKKRINSASYGKNYVKILDTKKNIVPKDYHRVLILAAGTSTVRLVIEKLYESLAADFLNKKIETQYYYLGSNKDDVSRKFKEIRETEHFDAFMVFIQNDPSLLMETYFYRELPRALVRLNQSIAVQLYDATDARNSIWEAMMQMNFALTHDRSYKNISENLLKNMKENFLCD
jgi:site-specific DNA-cytosine methylase